MFLFSKVKASACCLVSRHSVSVVQNSSSNPKTRRVRDTLKWTWEEGVQTPDVVLLSEFRVYTQMRRVYTEKHVHIGKPRVMNGSDNSGDLSLRDACSGNRECVRKIFHSKQCWFQTQRLKWTFSSQTARWFLKMSTLTWRMKNIPNCYTSEELTGEIDEARIKGRKVGIGTISNKIVGYWYQIKLQEFKIITQYK